MAFLSSMEVPRNQAPTSPEGERKANSDFFPSYLVISGWPYCSIWVYPFKSTLSAVQVPSLCYRCQEICLSLINIYLTNSRDRRVCLEESCVRKGEWMLGKVLHLFVSFPGVSFLLRASCWDCYHCPCEHARSPSALGQSLAISCRKWRVSEWFILCSRKLGGRSLGTL